MGLSHTLDSRSRHIARSSTPSERPAGLGASYSLERAMVMAETSPNSPHPTFLWDWIG